ncbi:MAG: hypothetical protein M3209_00395 [Acidobacteriota bacterium]|nr:hypothetical protein [Acidobacteriota bacterium]
MLNSIAVLLLKMLLAYLGTNLDEEAGRQLADYNRRKAEVEAEGEKSAAEIAEIERSNARLAEERRELGTNRILLESQISEIEKDIERLNHEKADKLLRIDDLSDLDVLRSEF